MGGCKETMHARCCHWLSVQHSPQIQPRARTEFQGETCPPTFGQGDTIYFVPPIFCDKKCCTCTNFVVTLLLKSPSISRGINEKNWHYHWTPKPCRYLSCTQGYIKWIILPRYCQGVCEVQWCKVSHVWQNLNTIPKYTTNNGII